MLATRSCLTCDPMDCSLPSCCVHGILQARLLEWVATPFSRGSSRPREQTQISCVVGRFFTIWATREPKNTGVGSLSLLQRIFPTQESNHGLSHCRQILFQLSHQGSRKGSAKINIATQCKMVLWSVIISFNGSSVTFYHNYRLQVDRSIIQL